LRLTPHIHVTTLCNIPFFPNAAYPSSSLASFTTVYEHSLYIDQVADLAFYFRWYSSGVCRPTKHWWSDWL